MAFNLLLAAFGVSLGAATWWIWNAAAHAIENSPAAPGDLWCRWLASRPWWVGRLRPRIVELSLRAGQAQADPERLAAQSAVLGSSALVLGVWLAGPAGLAGVSLASVPYLRLRDRGVKRIRAVERAFPFAVDLMALAVESGLHVEWAVRKIQPRLAPGPLRDEMGQLLATRTVGRAWSDALKELAARTASEQVRSVVWTLVQAEASGMSLGPLLKNLADDLRQKRLSWAEEQAHRAPVRMLFPLVFCILPVVFVVLLGPILYRFFTL